MKAQIQKFGRGLLRALLATAVAFSVAACDSEELSFYDNGAEGSGEKPSGRPATSPACSRAEQNEAIYDDMLDRYFWNDKVPTNLNVRNYTDPRKLLKDLRYDELDHWSFLLTPEQAEEFEAGEGTDFGINLLIDGNRIRVSFVHPQSNAQKVGLKRGDTVLSINGTQVPSRKLTDDDLTDVYRNLYSGKSAKLVLLGDGSAADRTVTVTMGKISSMAVTQGSVIDATFGKVGYMLYTEFTDQSEEAIEKVFAKFKRANISELVLDLRYNGGGSLETSRLLASYIGGKLTESEVYTSLRHNQKHSRDNFDAKFSRPLNSLGLNRVVVLTTDNTASASESVINGLKPFIDVVLVGQTTHGKPVGMNPQWICDVYMVAINFEGVNAKGDGRFYGGIPANCAADDDLDHALGDQTETMLATALDYLKTGRCSAPVSAAHTSDGAHGPVATWRRFLH